MEMKPGIDIIVTQKLAADLETAHVEVNDSASSAHAEVSGG